MAEGVEATLPSTSQGLPQEHPHPAGHSSRSGVDVGLGGKQVGWLRCWHLSQGRESPVESMFEQPASSCLSARDLGLDMRADHQGTLAKVGRFSGLPWNQPEATLQSPRLRWRLPRGRPVRVVHGSRVRRGGQDLQPLPDSIDLVLIFDRLPGAERELADEERGESDDEQVRKEVRVEVGPWGVHRTCERWRGSLGRVAWRERRVSMRGCQGREVGSARVSK